MSCNSTVTLRRRYTIIIINIIGYSSSIDLFLYSYVS